MGSCGRRRANSAISRRVTAGAKQRLARRHDANGLEQLLRGHVLEEESAGAGRERVVDVLVQIERGQDEHARSGVTVGR